MNVTDILLNFRQALLAVLPFVEKANIPWQRLDAYDEWDAIASALFNALVVEVLRYSLQKPLQEQFMMPGYDLFLESYAGLCVVEVTHPLFNCGQHIFHSFGTRKSAFDIVEVRRIAKNGHPYNQELIQCIIDDASFYLKLDRFRNYRCDID